MKIVWQGDTSTRTGDRLIVWCTRNGDRLIVWHIQETGTG